jgi:hypothetical protein
MNNQPSYYAKSFEIFYQLIWNSASSVVDESYKQTMLLIILDTKLVTEHF